MCVDDIRLARFIRTNFRNWTAGAGNGALPSNPQRVGLTCGLYGPAAIATGVVLVTCGGQGVTQLNSTMMWRHITLQWNGDLPTKAFDITAVTGTPSGVWIEYILPEEYLSLLPDLYKARYNPNPQR